MENRKRKAEGQLGGEPPSKIPKIDRKKLEAFPKLQQKVLDLIVNAKNRSEAVLSIPPEALPRDFYMQSLFDANKHNIKGKFIPALVDWLLKNDNNNFSYKDLKKIENIMMEALDFDGTISTWQEFKEILQDHITFGVGFPLSAIVYEDKVNSSTPVEYLNPLYAKPMKDSFAKGLKEKKTILKAFDQAGLSLDVPTNMEIEKDVTDTKGIYDAGWWNYQEKVQVYKDLYEDG